MKATVEGAQYPVANETVSGFRPGIFLGYDTKINCSYLGINVFGLFGDTRYREDNGTRNYRLSMEHIWGADGNIGVYAARNVAAYGILGFQRQKVVIRDLEKAKPGVANSKDTETKSHKDLNAFNVGAGLKVGLNDHLFLKTEYKYSMYRKVQFEKAKLATNAHGFTLGIGYTF
jgi:opacity protein-like surface antigen